MKNVCIGGVPAGMYFGLLMKKLDDAHDVTVVERNKRYDTFGRMPQSSFYDRVRLETGIQTIVASAISEAAKIGFTEVNRPKQYRSAKVQLESNIAREKAAAGRA